MKALAYHGPGQRGWDDVPNPTSIDATDIIVRITCSTSCSTDLHILTGVVPETTAGTIPGHEAVGIVGAGPIGHALKVVRQGGPAASHTDADHAVLVAGPS